jgi:hypothetical protein
VSSPGPRPKTLDSWVRRVCRNGAARLRCTTDEGSKLVRVASKGKRGPDIVSALRAVVALDPGKVEALDADGDVLDVFDVPDPDELETPGYVKDDADSKEERMLKTFAHLLADAHKISSRQLVEVVSLQSHGYQEERRHLHGALAASDRLLRRMSNPRVRIATDDEGEGEPREAAEGGDDFLAQMMGPILKRMMQEELSGAAAKPAANGTAAKVEPDA